MAYVWWYPKTQLCSLVCFPVVLISVLISVVFLSLPVLGSASLSISQVDAAKFPVIECYVSVADSLGNPIHGLDWTTFSVSEQSDLEISPTLESPIDVREVSGQVGGIAVVLVMDRSGSMSGAPMVAAKQAAKDFIAALGDNDMAAIVAFGSGASLLQGFTYNKNALTSAIDLIAAGGNTALFDGIIEALDETGTVSGVKAVIAFTDGYENNSTHMLADVLSAAVAVSVPVYTIGIGSSIDEPGLTDIAVGTGGVYKHAPQTSELLDLYNYIARLTRDLYLVTYTTHNPFHDDTARTVAISADTQAGVLTDSRSYVVGATPLAPVISNIQIWNGSALVSPGASVLGGTALRITANVVDDVQVQKVTVAYRQTPSPGQGALYALAEMQSLGTGQYAVTISGTDVCDPGLDFYVSATDGSLTSTCPPNDASLHPAQIPVLPNHAPVISHVPVTSAPEGSPVTITADITDQDTGDRITQADILFRTTGHILYTSLPMVRTSGAHYEGTIPSSVVAAAGVDYYILTQDARGVSTYAGTDTTPYHITVAGAGGGCAGTPLRIGRLQVAGDGCIYDSKARTYTLQGHVRIGTTSGVYFVALGADSSITCTTTGVLALRWAAQITVAMGPLSVPVAAVASAVTLDPSAGTVTLRGELKSPVGFSLVGTLTFDLYAQTMTGSVVLDCPIFRNIGSVSVLIDVPHFIVKINGAVNVDLECSPIVFVKAGFTLELDFSNFVFTIGLSAKGLILKDSAGFMEVSLLKRPDSGVSIVTGTVRFDLPKLRMEVLDELSVSIPCEALLAAAAERSDDEAQGDGGRPDPRAGSGSLCAVGLHIATGTVVQLSPLTISGTAYLDLDILMLFHFSCVRLTLNLDWQNHRFDLGLAAGLSLGKLGQSPLMNWEIGGKLFFDLRQPAFGIGGNVKLVNIPGLGTGLNIKADITVDLKSGVYGVLRQDFTLLGFQVSAVNAGLSLEAAGISMHVQLQVPGAKAKALLTLGLAGISGQFEENIAPFGIPIQTGQVAFSLSLQGIKFHATVSVGDSSVAADFAVSSSGIAGVLAGNVTLFGADITTAGVSFVLNAGGVKFSTHIQFFGFLGADANLGVGLKSATVTINALKVFDHSLVGVSGTLSAGYFSATGSLLGATVGLEVSRDAGIKLHLTTFGFAWFSPVEVHLYDSLGRHVGPNSAGGIDEEIPGASYTTNGDTGVILIEGFDISGGGYELVIIGKASGVFHLELVYPDSESDTVVLATYPETATSPTMEARIGITQASSLALTIDANGDGTMDQIVTPELVRAPWAASFNQAPAIEIQHPREEERLSVSPVSITWVAADPDDSVDTLLISLAYRSEGEQEWSEIASHLRNTGAFAWDITPLLNGEYSLRAEAEDDDGSVATAESGLFSITRLVGAAMLVAPNPVSDQGCVLLFDPLADVSSAEIIVFTANGRLVFRTQVDPAEGCFPSDGVWLAEDLDGVLLANGPYVCVLVADGSIVARAKMVIQR
ncbi:MAG: VWA domain-containing protein [Thermotogota bacterium]